MLLPKICELEARARVVHVAMLDHVAVCGPCCARSRCPEMKVMRRSLRVVVDTMNAVRRLRARELKPRFGIGLAHAPDY